MFLPVQVAATEGVSLPSKKNARRAKPMVDCHDYLVGCVDFVCKSGSGNTVWIV